EPFYRSLGCHSGEIQRALAAAQVFVNALQHGEVKALLATEIVVDHPLVGARAAGDLVHPAPPKAPACAPVLRSQQAGVPCPVWIAANPGLLWFRSASLHVGAVDRPTRPILSFEVTTQLPWTFAVRRGHGESSASPLREEEHHENLETGTGGRCGAHVRHDDGFGTAENHLRPQLGRRR